MIFFGPTFIGFMEALLWVLATTIILTPLYVLGPDVESYLFPVIKNFSATLVRKDESFSYYTLLYRKVRSCDPIIDDATWYGVDKNGVNNRIFVEPLRPPGSETSKPLGVNRSGLFRADMNGELYDHFKVVFYHRCHPLWRSKTEVEF